MLNFEKYKDEILKITEEYDDFAVDKKTNKICRCNGMSCVNCKFYNECCNVIKLKWLYKEQTQLTHDEYVILKNIDKHYELIARDLDNNLYLFQQKPRKIGRYWESSGDFICFGMFNHLFQFVKWEDEEPYNIQELLNNYEVIEDE